MRACFAFVRAHEVTRNHHATTHMFVECARSRPVLGPTIIHCGLFSGISRVCVCVCQWHAFPSSGEIERKINNPDMCNCGWVRRQTYAASLYADAIIDIIFHETKLVQYMMVILQWKSAVQYFAVTLMRTFCCAVWVWVLLLGTNWFSISIGYSLR